MPEEELTNEQLAEKFREVLEKWPLYRKFAYTGGKYITRPPSPISLFCDGCEGEQLWQAHFESRASYRNGNFTLDYTCRNCVKNRVLYYYIWDYEDNEGTFIKIGQFPALEERIPREVEKQLDAEDRKLYKKALRSRNFNFGLGALAYLRRVVEKRMNDILDLLAESAKEADFAPKELARIERVKKMKRFDDKVTYAAGILPTHLKPGGQNPIDSLHDLASEGIHAKSEDECIEIFDQCKLAFEYVFRDLQLRKEQAKAYIETLKAISERKSPGGEET